MSTPKLTTEELLKYAADQHRELTADNYHTAAKAIEMLTARLRELEEDKARLEFAMKTNIQVLPTGDGRWILLDWRDIKTANKGEFDSYEAAIDAARAKEGA